MRSAVGMSRARSPPVRALAVVALIPLLGGCRTLILGSSSGPLRTVEFPVSSKSRTLLVMIHGAGDRPESFRAHHFVQELEARHADVDAIAIEIKVAYFLDGDLAERIHEDVMLPARRRGFRRVILLGVSIGGLGALLYARRHPEQVDGLILFAPFLGPRMFAREIKAQGGLRRWWPNPPYEDVEFVWLFLADYARGRSDPPIDLMYGTQDRMASTLSLLAAVLPKKDVHVIEGRHQWSSWLSMWRAHLERDPFHLIAPDLAQDDPGRPNGRS